MKETIAGILLEYTLITIGYLFLITVVLIIVICNRFSKHNKYIVWKSSKINLGFYKKKWERDEDAFLKELFEENIRLEKENKKLNKQLNKLSILVLIVYAIQNLKDKVRDTFHKKAYLSYQEEMEIFDKKIKVINAEIEKVTNSNISPSSKTAELTDLYGELEDLEIEQKAFKIRHRKSIADKL